MLSRALRAGREIGCKRSQLPRSCPKSSEVSALCRSLCNSSEVPVPARQFSSPACRLQHVLSGTRKRGLATSASGPKKGDKTSALALALRQIESTFGKGAVMKLGSGADHPEVEVISTGSLTLNAALGCGGLPKGRVVEIYGPESSGKTSLALHVIAEAQKKGGTCTFIDAEHSLDPHYAKALGINLEDLYISQPDSGEQALEIADTLIRSAAVDVVVVDSVAALVPRAELEGDMGDHHMALQARLMSQALRKLTSSLSKSNCLLIFINQIRHKIGIVFGNPEVTAGGNALKFYASVRMEVRKKGPIKAGDEIIGNETKVKITKNKMAPPFKEAEFDLIFGKGIGKTGELVDLGIKAGVFKRSGSWFSFAKDIDDIYKTGTNFAQGRERAKAFLEENPEVAKAVEAEVNAFMMPKHKAAREPLIDLPLSGDGEEIAETKDNAETTATI